MDRFSGSAPVPMDAEIVTAVLGDREFCVHCNAPTRKLWFNLTGRRVAHACCVEHLTEEYPHYTTDATEWE